MANTKTTHSASSGLVKKTASKVEVKKEAVKAPKKEINTVEKKVNTDMKKADQKLSKIIAGTVVSTKMEKTVVVSYTRKVAHKKYGKLIKVTKRIKADTNGIEVSLGDSVKIQQTKPMSKGKFFKVIEIVTAKAKAKKEEKA